MYRNHRVITVSPAGRRRYARLLAAHLNAQRPFIDEHHWWVNTDDPEDRAFLERTAAADPSFWKLVYQREVAYRPAANSYHFSIHPFFQRAADPGAVYVRCDDDVVWMERDAVRRLVDYRLDHPRPFAVIANTINNPICAHLHERFGVFETPSHFWYATHNCHADPRGLARQPNLALFLHQRFLYTLARGALEPWKFDRWVLFDHAQVPVNCVAWLGKDIAALPAPGIQYHEEHELTVRLPRALNRPNEICGRVLVAHFAYTLQRAALDATTLLSQYEERAPRLPFE